MIALVMTWNGRPDTLAQSIPSLDLLSGPITHRILVNDSGQELNVDGWWVIDHHGNRGLAAAVQSGWNQALAHDDVRFVCHWEDDMVLERPLDLAQVSTAFQPGVAQIAFQRHPVNAVEAQGQLVARVVASNYSWYDPARNVTYHDDLFSLNPCLIPLHVVQMGWPSGPLGVGNEDGFTAKCKAAGLFFATWGSVVDVPLIRHIGHERAAAWSL